MSNIKLIQLSHLPIEIIDGDRGVNYPSKMEFTKEGYCIFLNTSNVSKFGFDFTNIECINKERDILLKKGKLQFNDLVLTTRGTIGNVAFYNRNIQHKNIRINSGMIILRSDENQIHAYYLYLFLRSDIFKKQVLSHGSGSAQPQLPISSLKHILFPFTKLSNQQKITSVLSALDTKIKLNSKINAELEAMAKTLYDYWFVQFDFSIEEGKPYKSSGGEMVFNEVLKREIPKGWEVKSFGDFVANDKSGDWGKEESEGNYTTKVECIRGADINGINGKGEVKAPTRYILEKNEHKILNEGDLVVEISGGSPTQSTGRLAYVTKEVIDRFKNPIICSNFCKAVSLKAENQFFYFIYSWYRAYDNGIFFGFEGKTSGIKNLLFESLVDTYKVATPSDDLLDKFEATISTLEQKRQLNLKQNQELASLRDWLLPMLMNGQVTIASAYKEVEEKLAMVADGEVKYGK
jgi:type I restriction enzyme S subunit